MSSLSASPAKRSTTHATLWIAALLFASLSGVASSHELYLQPRVSNSGDALLLDLLIGHAFAGESISRPASFLSLERLDARGNTWSVASGARLGPLGFLPREAGPLLFVYRSEPIPHQLSAARFDAYLEEEGLDRVRAARAARDAKDEPGRELYSRCAQAAYPALTSQPLPPTLQLDAGCRLQLHLQDAPRRADDPHGSVSRENVTNRSAVAKVTFDGQPVADLLLRHSRRANDGQVSVVQLRTDQSGEVVLSLPLGQHLLNVVHAVPAATEGYEWRSYWTSLNFEVASEAQHDARRDSPAPRSSPTARF